MVRFLLNPVKVVGFEVLPTIEVIVLVVVFVVVVVVVVLFVCGRRNVVLKVASSCGILSAGITPTEIRRLMISSMSASSESVS